MFHFYFNSYVLFIFKSFLNIHCLETTWYFYINIIGKQNWGLKLNIKINLNENIQINWKSFFNLMWIFNKGLSINYVTAFRGWREGKFYKNVTICYYRKKNDSKLRIFFTNYNKLSSKINRGTNVDKYTKRGIDIRFQQKKMSHIIINMLPIESHDYPIKIRYYQISNWKNKKSSAK